MGRFVVGDIHGGYRGLKQVLERANFDNARDSLVAVGDVVDGWSETPQSIDLLMSIKNLTYILGNHDEWFLHFVEGKINPDGHQMGQSNMAVWLSNGGLATLNAYKNPDGNTYNKEVLDKHYHFLKGIHKMYHVEDNMLFVHAGYNNRFPLEKNTSENLCWDRWFWREVHRGNKTLSTEYEKVFIGHTPTLNWESFLPMKALNVWNVDTGAAYNGKLTIMNIDTEEYFQSDYLLDLYPAELGRNRTR